MVRRGREWKSKQTNQRGPVKFWTLFRVRNNLISNGEAAAAADDDDDDGGVFFPLESCERDQV